MTEILEAINKAKTILIAGHMRPDGDCLGSAFALREYCLNLGKIAEIYSSSDIPEDYKFIKGIDCVNALNYSKYDLFIAVDCANIDRLGAGIDYFNTASDTVCIDHHENNYGFGNHNKVVESASSTCELVYDILEPTGKITPVIATHLYMGLSTDTGHFMHNNTTPKVLYTAYRLAHYGAETYKLANDLYRTRSKEKTNLICKALESMRYYEEGKVAIIVITQDMLNECGLTSNDTEGIIDYTVAVKGVEVGISICEVKANEYKISLRSRVRSVSVIANIFGGGGHMYAAGCRIFGSKEDVIDKILRAVRITAEE